jgi:hypothetical protein
VISDTLLPQPDKNAPPRAAVVVRRTFAPSMLYAQFEVYGAAREKGSAMPRVSAGYEIRRKGDGTVALKAEPTRITPTSLGKLARFVGASLEQVPDGDYEFVLTVTDQVANKTVEVREPFTLSASAPKPVPPPATP